MPFSFFLKKKEPVNLFENGLPGPQFHSEQDLYLPGRARGRQSPVSTLPFSSPLASRHRAPWIDRSFVHSRSKILKWRWRRRGERSWPTSACRRSTLRRREGLSPRHGGSCRRRRRRRRGRSSTRARSPTASSPSSRTSRRSNPQRWAGSISFSADACAAAPTVLLGSRIRICAGWFRVLSVRVLIFFLIKMRVLILVSCYGVI